VGDLRIVVAEDEFLVRQALGDLVQDEPGWHLQASCQDLDQLMAEVAREPPDIVLTDIRMPPAGSDEGIQAAVALERSHPDVGVVVLSHYAEPSYVVNLLRGGVRRRGYLLKQHLAEPGQLWHAVLAVADGRSYVDAEVMRVWASTQGHRHTSRLGSLTPREQQVLSAMATGRNNTAIARQLVITERSVEKHVNAIFAKLAVSAEPGRHGRVTAVLAYLRETAGIGDAEPAANPAPGRSSPAVRGDRAAVMPPEWPGRGWSER